MGSASKATVIVQARMGSSRLPGKVLNRLAGRTVLDHVLARCLAIESADRVVCATTTSPADDAIVAEAERVGAAVYRGSETDVLGRYREAARAFDADVILRVTSDCPLIDPELCERVLLLRAERQVGFADNNTPRTFPHGLDCEAFTREVLELAADSATAPYDREHVTPWMRRQPDVARAALASPDASLAGLRWTLDTPADLEFFKALFEVLPNGSASTRWTTALGALQNSPKLTDLCAMAERLSR